MRITDDVRAIARQMAEGRCECTGANCRHHRNGARCKRGLRPDQWKVYWHSSDGGATRGNLDAWCLECFANNFTVPTSSVTILASDVAGCADLAATDRRKAITAMAVLRDAADIVASANHGRLIRAAEDDVRVEFAKTPYAIAAARALHSKFQEQAGKLGLPTSELATGIHRGEVTRSQDGDLFGETLGLAALVRRVARAGQIVLSGPAVDELGSKIEVEDLGDRSLDDVPHALRCWALRL